MSIACVTELSAISNQSFEDAINMAVNRTTQTLRNVEGAWVKGMNVMIENNTTTFGILRAPFTVRFSAYARTST